MKVDDIVLLQLHVDASSLGLDLMEQYVVTKVFDNYLGLDKGVDGMLYHKKFFRETGRSVPAKYICVMPVGTYPWIRVGEIYDGEDLGDNHINILARGNKHVAPKASFSKVRTWEEAQRVFGLMYQSNIENALKFTKWSDSNVSETDATKSEGTDPRSYSLDQGRVCSV